MITDATQAKENKAEFVMGQKTYVVDGQTKQMDVAPFIDENGRTAVPLRFLALALGILEKDIKWCEKEQTVSLTKEDTTVEVTVGKTALSINRMEQERQRKIVEEEQRRRMEELRRLEQNPIKPPVTQRYTPPTYTPTVPYTPPTYSPTQPWSPGGIRW